MQTVEKTTSKKWAIVRTLWKGGILLGGFVLAVFLLAHFALQYGIHLDNVANSLKKHWLIWLLIRSSIYGLAGVLLYKAYQHTTQVVRLELKKIVRALVICVVVVEMINFLQIMG